MHVCMFSNYLLDHNQFHAADVMQATIFFIGIPSISTRLSELEKFALVFAAMIHDFDHPGVNNRFLINSRANKALLYNDIAVLENHHVAAIFIHLEDNKNNFLSNLTTKDFLFFRKLVVEVVLATDLSTHFTFMTELRRALVIDMLTN